ncbi:ADP-ribosylglycohydrolase [Lentzea albidocapillata subsp. violacea]|uniref:ADP-ribosylglycohydrolase n=1 Tax=Lentzea albidocapillata subsp. violacea TaxID=128104 RepID=A0A1G9M2N5_9PSEU|nr:ADP-ribosylglycohydrolase family protein [Lentzea albidocapillata]SDL68476.1 ADP-ribosylglycohydrolase [Lentzea albidocapillata subsp. violacea]
MTLLGCVLGGAVGDGLGAPIEFSSIDTIRHLHGPSGVVDLPSLEITDDTQMVLFTLEGLLLARQHGVDPRLTVRAAYGRWLHTQGGPPVANDGWLMADQRLHSRRAPGHTCITALKHNEKNNSKGCGGVMRAAPVAVWSPDVREVFSLAADTARMTHHHPSGYLSAGALAVIVQALLAGSDLISAVAVARAELVRWEGHEEQTSLLDKVMSLGPLTPEEIESELGGGWVGEEALAIGLHAALVGTDFADAVRTAVNHSGDSDSTGSICGNILGARDGLETIPDAWLAVLELRDEMERLVLSW